MALSIAASAPATVVVDGEKQVLRAIDDLASESVKRRYWATAILGRYPRFSESSIPVLRRALEDREWPVRLGAARALEAVGPQAPDMATVAALARRLQDGSQEVRAAASYAVAQLGMPLPTMLPLLESGVASGSARLRVASSIALVRLFPESAVPVFEAALMARVAATLLRDTLDAEKGTGERWTEVPGLRAARLGAAVALLDAEVAYSEIPDLLDRSEAGSSASFHAVRAMAPHLTALLSDVRRSVSVGDLEARRRAALTVGMLGIEDPASLSGLADLLTQEPVLAEAAARALGMLGESARAKAPALRSLLLSGSERRVREAAGLALIRVDRGAAEEAAGELRIADSEFSLWLTKAIIRSQL